MNPVPLIERQADYDQAEQNSMRVARLWIEARAQGKPNETLDREMDTAQRELLRSKRRLERTERHQ